MDVSCIVAAAGKGKRMGMSVNKQFTLLAGKPVLVHTLEGLSGYAFSGISVVVAPGEEDYCKKNVLEPYNLGDTVKLVSGGEERQDSVFNALKSLPFSTDIVVIHDGARPFVTREILKETIEASVEHRASITAVPVKDTIKIGTPGEFVVDTPPRNSLWSVQTPQAFCYSLIYEAYCKAYESGFKGTDDASLVERIKHPVKIVKGSYKNIKITTPEDLVTGEALLKG